MYNFENENLLEPLSDSEKKLYSGGQPDEDSGFWYDVFYVLTASILVNPRPTSWATSVSPY